MTITKQLAPNKSTRYGVLGLRVSLAVSVVFQVLRVAGAQLQIFGAVVVSNAIKVVDGLTLYERAANFFLHYKHMLMHNILMSSVVTGRPHQPVAIPVQKSSATLPRRMLFAAKTHNRMFTLTHKGVVALAAAKVVLRQLFSPLNKVVATLRASNHSFMFHTYIIEESV